jgi:peptidoglycan/xylan/chitin deacetylase (PgdA/CDA1 family)
MTLMAVSVLLHLGAVAWLLAAPHDWPWVLAAIVANHGVIGAATLSPRGRWMGPNLVRADAAAARGEICLSFDDGPDPQVTPRVLELLERHGAKASFFCIGERAAAQPELVREMVRRGHSVENHSYSHSNAFAFYGRARTRAEVDRAQAAITAIAGRAPRFFRAPVGFRNALLSPVLASRGLRYVSWTRRGYDGVSNDAEKIFRRLVRGLSPGDILLLHDSRSVVLEVLPRLLEEAGRQGWRCVGLPDALEPQRSSPAEDLERRSPAG